MSGRTRNPLAAAFAKYSLTATVEVTERVTPTMLRIRLVADEPVGFPHAPGQHVRIQIKDPLSMYGILRPAETLRTYTLWDFVPAERALELRVHLYEGDGIGLRWALAARPGDPVTLWWPQGDLVVRQAPFHVFVGEETASAAFGPLLRALGPAARVFGVLESESAEHDLPMPGPHQLRRLHRHGAPAASSPTLVAGVADLELPDAPASGEPDDAGAVYVAGEALTCRLVRDHLVQERGWPKAAIKVKPFWVPGKRGLH